MCKTYYVDPQTGRDTNDGLTPEKPLATLFAVNRLALAPGDTVLLKHGQSIAIANLPSGTTYSVTESGSSGYRTEASGDTGVIPANAQATAAFTNSKSKVPPTGDDNSKRIGLVIMGISAAGILALLLINKGLLKNKKRV